MQVKKLLAEFSKIKSLPLRRKRGQEIAKKLKEDELKVLIEKLQKEDSKTSWDLVAHLITPALSVDYPDFVLSIIKKLAGHEDWEIREEAATVIKRLKPKYFENLLPVFKEWVKDKDPFLKRAISVGLIKPFPQERERLDEIFALFEEIIQCDDPYVKKNAGPFGLAAIFRRYPQETEKRLISWLDKYSDNPTVVWNVMSVFSQANAKYFPQAGKRVLARIKDKGFLEKFPKLKRSWEGIWHKLEK